MFKKNVAIAFRSLKKNISYVIINLAGLTIGITCCLLILSFVKYELSFDNFHAKKDQIYRVNYDVLMGGTRTISPSVPVFVGPELKKMFPEVEDATRFTKEWRARTIRHGDVFFDEKNFGYADPNFFKVFDFKDVEGDLRTALSKPNTLVITKAIAAKYFGKEDPVGKSLLFNNKKEFTTAAVIDGVPFNSTFTFDFLTSFYSIEGFDSLQTKIEWNNPNYDTYLLLNNPGNVTTLSAKIENWMNPPSEQHSSGNALHLALEPLSKIHFDTEVFNFGNNLAVTDFKYIRIFIAIAAFVLLIACANYINLSTARTTNRAKEVGIKKTIGASFRQLFAQFMAESFLLVLPSVVISVVGVYLLLPSLNNLLGKDIPFYIFHGDFPVYIIGGTILISLLAGLYPSLVLSRLRPLITLKKNALESHKSGLTVRKALVVFQFAISAVLILGTLVVWYQLKFMQSQKLGLDKDHVVMITGNADINNKLDAFSNELRKISRVQNVALTWRSPFSTVVGNGFSITPNPTKSEDWHVVGGIAGDQNYLSALGIQLLAGRNFDPSKIKGDSTVNEYLVNEAFLHHYNLKPEEAINKKVILGLTGPGEIVGVVKDFHTASLHSVIEPIVVFNRPAFFSSILVKIGPGDLSSVLGEIEKTWKGFVPMRPFNYSFLDEEYDAMYRTEQRLSVLMSLFCCMAILITCLGLLGLIAFMVSRCIKEIGIRKVLGASVQNIAVMLSKDFVKLVIIAIVIASPVAWILMHKWLEDFAYRIDMHWWLFLYAAFGSIFLAIVTISFQAVKAAVANPVKSLRTE